MSVFSLGDVLPAASNGGQRKLVQFTIGSRDDLTKAAARRMADAWRQMTKE